MDSQLVFEVLISICESVTWNEMKWENGVSWDWDYSEQWPSFILLANRKHHIYGLAFQSIYKLVKGRCSFIRKNISRRAPLPVKTPHGVEPREGACKTRQGNWFSDGVCCSLTACSPGSDSLTHCNESQHRPFEITLGRHTGFEDESALLWSVCYP